MTRRELAVRLAALGVAGLCLFLAVGLGLLALDVARWRDAFPAGDVRYRVAPEEDLWSPATRVPHGLAEGLLDVDDDVDLRLAVRALRLARLDDPNVSDAELALLRNEAQARLEAVAGGSDTAARRSRAAGLLGVLGLARLTTETQERDVLLQYAISSFQRALAFDGENDEAKLNLEIALQRGQSIELLEAAAGRNPTPGGSGSRGAGAGEPGSGY